MSIVGLYVHPGRVEAIELGRTVARWLRDRDHTVVLEPSEATLLGGDEHALATDHPSLDLMIAIGGDGTVLRGTSRAVAADADVLGINLGELGYLAEVEPAAWEDALTTYFAGGHGIEHRMLVAGAVAGRSALPPALNEVVIEKNESGRTVRLGVSIDGDFFTSYVADGLIVASPTGSTAYSLSARGPIVDPSHRALVMTPVSPHTLFDRSLVLGPDSVVAVTLLDGPDARLSIDGQDHGLIGPDEIVTITAAPEPARFVTFGRRNFHQILKAKFRLSDR